VALVAAVAGALMGFAPAAFAEPPAPPAPIIPPPVQPANVGDLKFEATQYYESGAHLTDLQQAAATAIFFITGRNEPQHAATERNLQAVGYTGYTQLIMEPTGAHYVSAADFKAPQRAQIEQRGYTIIANVGDQPSDLDGGFAERTYLLPDPFHRIP
jgi:hypothetical protein